jgi:hypothetical protein
MAARGVLMTSPASGPSVAATLARVNTDHPIADGLDIDGDQALVHDGPTGSPSAEAPEAGRLREPSSRSPTGRQR